MPPTDPVIIDAYAGLSHKSPLRNNGVGVGSQWLAPTWVGEANRRRLAAYKVLAAYLNNVARNFLALAAADPSNIDRHVEYGDAAAVRNAIVGTLLGDEQTITVDGADDELPEAPDAPQPVEGEVPTTPEAQPGQASPDEVAAERARIEAARARQEWLRAWADKERLSRKLFEGERNAVGLGDGVYLLRWSNAKQRVRVLTFDPGFYFPVLSTDLDEDFPTTVHFAWEEEETNELGETRTFVRRITYRLAPITGRKVPPQGALSSLRTAVGQFDVEPPVRADAGPGGTFTRNYPWNDKPSGITCYMSDGRWPLESIGNRRVANFGDADVEWTVNEDGEQMRDLDLEIDFIPVVHVPNTVAEGEHFGRSALTDIAQILDELAEADSDLAAAAATTGTPPIALTGSTVRDVVYGPGRVWNLAAGGRLDVVDTSKALDALLKYIEALLRRMSTNARVPESVLGRIDPAQIASGVLLALSFGPLKQLNTEMSLVRNEKLPLLCKFVQRMAIAHGELESGDAFPAQIVYGSHLPHDRAEAVDLVRKLLGNGTEPSAISRVTALRMLVDAGFDIGDALDELERIEGEDFRGAKLLLEALGDEGAVFDYLGRAPTPGSRPLTPTAAVAAGLTPVQLANQGGRGFTPSLPGQPPIPPPNTPPAPAALPPGPGQGGPPPPA